MAIRGGRGGAGSCGQLWNSSRTACTACMRTACEAVQTSGEQQRTQCEGAWRDALVALGSREGDAWMRAHLSSMSTSNRPAGKVCARTLSAGNILRRVAGGLLARVGGRSRGGDRGGQWQANQAHLRASG